MPGYHLSSWMVLSGIKDERVETSAVEDERGRGRAVSKMSDIEGEPY